MQTTPNYHYCYLGAIGWDHPDWAGAFYPDDIPAEWHLNYYNTLFECVYLPYAQWHTATPEALERWRSDTLDQFRFLLEPPPTADSDTDESRMAILGDKAVIADPRQGPTLLWLKPDTPLRQLAQSLQALEQSTPIYLLSVSGDLAQLEQTRILLEVMGY